MGMKWDEMRRDALLLQDDETLRPRVAAVMEALGVPEGHRRRLLGDLSTLRQRAASVTEADFQRLCEALGEETVTQLVALLEGSYGGSDKSR